jgi:hypothetical protein
MFLTFVTILPLTIPANYRLSSQFLSVGLKVGVRVWYKVNVRFGFYTKVFIIVPDAGNGVGETLHFRQQYLSKMGSFLTYLLNFWI